MNIKMDVTSKGRLSRNLGIYETHCNERLRPVEKLNFRGEVGQLDKVKPNFNPILVLFRPA